MPCLVFADARGDVFRGLEVVEQACGVGVAMMGETLAGVAKGMDTHSYREPLGVCAGEFAGVEIGTTRAMSVSDEFVRRTNATCPGCWARAYIVEFDRVPRSVPPVYFSSFHSVYFWHYLYLPARARVVSLSCT